jgi:hypothetical protein
VVAGDTDNRRLSVFRSLLGNTALVRVVAAYALFIVTEYSVWIAMLVYAYSRGGATVAGLVALAQLVPAAVLAPIAAAAADRRSPVVLLAGGYLAQAAGMAATAAAVAAGAPFAAYATAVVASTAVATTRPAQSAIVPSVSATPDQLTRADRAAALAPVVRRAACPGDRRPGRGALAAGGAGRHRADPAGRSGRCLLCDRGG